MEPSYEDLKERVQQLEGALLECERLAVANRFASAIMHEVNNPLEALTNLAYLMHFDGLSREATEHLRLMEEQLAVLTAVTRPALSFHREQRVAKRVDFVSLVDSVKKLHDGRIASSGLKLLSRCPQEAQCEVIGSEMLQVLSNLLLNAVDAMTEASCGSTIHIRVRRFNGSVCVCIADDGPGIPAHLELRLGEAYATGKEKGTGLGLWISKRIIENHRGVLRWRSSRKVGRSGTAFRIVLPCRTAGKLVA